MVNNMPAAAAWAVQDENGLRKKLFKKKIDAVAYAATYRDDGIVGRIVPLYLQPQSAPTPFFEGHKMTDRDHFATAALTGLLNGLHMTDVYLPATTAKQAYELADAMLRERLRTDKKCSGVAASWSAAMVPLYQTPTFTQSERDTIQGAIDDIGLYADEMGLSSAEAIEKQAALRAVLARMK